MAQQLSERLQACGQQHLLDFWNDLSEQEQQVLAGEIEAIDFDLLRKLAGQRDESTDWADLARRARPPQAIRLSGQGNRFSAAEARQRGADALAAGKVAAVLVAGGQGTRLGFDHPKGMFPIGPVSRATLFQILFEKLQAVGRRHQTSIPLYLMTSPATHEETIDFLHGHNRLGLAADQLRVFCQGTMPAVDLATGGVLLAEPGRIALSPDGHGGVLAALERGGLFDDMLQRGIEQIFYFQVDNPLARVCDAEFIGYHLLAGSEASTQVVAKTDPLERVGNVVEIDGRTQIIEYSDLPDEAAHRRAADNSLELWAGNVAVHVFDAAFLRRMSAGGGQLPFHVARKRVPYVDASGELVQPEEPNAIKFERFIFDLLPAAERAIVVEVDASTDFAPVKNAPGAAKDSPEWVQQRMMDLHRTWLRRAGAEVADDARVEISPLYALDADELAARLPAGTLVEQPCYFK